MRIVQLANFYSPTSGGLRTVVDTLGRGHAGDDECPGHDHRWTDSLGNVRIACG